MIRFSLREGFWRPGTPMRRCGDAGQPSERLAATLRAYEIRARFRPTPNGVFAGVASVDFVRQAVGMQLRDSHRARSNPNPRWLAATCARVLEDPGVVPLLILTTSNLITRHGRRIEHEQRAEPGGTAARRITIRATDATVLILGMCARGTAGASLFAEVTRRWPDVPEPTVHTTVLGLIRNGFLLTDLLPDELSDDPLGHLLGTLPGSHPLRDTLSRLRRLLTDADRYPPGDPNRLAALRAAREVADDVSLQERPFTVDVLTDAQLDLPATLADEAAAAASVLWRIGSGRNRLSSYHDRFVDRYGPCRFVPLLEAVDPVIGIGIDTDIPRPDQAPQPRRRTAALAALLAQATTDGRTEVVLDGATIAALAEEQPAQPPPRTAEIHVRVLAGSKQDRAAGRLHLAVCPWGGSQDAGSTPGRLAAIIPSPPDREDSSAIVAELVVLPRATAAATLAPPTGLAQATGNGGRQRGNFRESVTITKRSTFPDYETQSYFPSASFRCLESRCDASQDHGSRVTEFGALLHEGEETQIVLDVLSVGDGDRGGL